MEENTNWKENNEAFQRNRRRRIRTGIVLALLAAAFAVLGIMNKLEEDKRGYTAALDTYYHGLYEGSDMPNMLSDKEITQEGKVLLGNIDYDSLQKILLQKECEQLSDKYGEDFSVQYRITSVERFTDEELNTLRENSMITPDIEKAYHLKVSEHIVGSKADGYEKQEITVLYTELGWGLSSERRMKIAEELIT